MIVTLIWRRRNKLFVEWSIHPAKDSIEVCSIWTKDLNPRYEDKQIYRVVIFLIELIYYMNKSALKQNQEKKLYPSDKMWRSKEAFGTPKWVVEVYSMAFKLCGKPTIYDSIATTLVQKIFHHVDHRSVLA